MQCLNTIKLSNKFSLSKNRKIINTKNIVASFFVVFLITCIVIKPALCINSVYSGLSVWAKCVLPSLLPFMFFTKLLTNLNFISSITNKFYWINKLLFKAPKISSYIFLMSIISGYPVGAKMINEYYRMGLLTNDEANKLSTFCSTSGPLFIIGSVGTAMLGSAKLGYLLFLSHIIGTILNGVIYRNAYVDKTKKHKENQSKLLISENINNHYENFESELNHKQDAENLLGKSMHDSIISVLLVGGYIAIAFLAIDIFNALNLFYPINFLLGKLGLTNNFATAITNGILEVSKGCLTLTNLKISITYKLTLASFLIGFGGICVFLQSATFLKDSKINLKFYLLQKFTHGILSAAVCFLFCTILNV